MMMSSSTCSPCLKDLAHIGADVGVDAGHHEIHDQQSYNCSDSQNVNSTTQFWMITVPNSSTRYHMLLGLDCNGELAFVLTEGADRTGTTALTSHNRDRDSSNTTSLVIHRDYSGGTTDGAETLETWRRGSTGFGAIPSATSGSRSTHEWLLKTNTKYIISATTFANVYVNLELNWYEI